MQESRRAVTQQNWSKVQELTARASTVRSMLVDKQSELKLAEEVYGAPELVIDPFSSAFDVLLNKTSQAKAALRSEAVAVLSALEKADRDWSSFYAGRRGYFTGLSVATSEPVQGKATKDDVGQFQQGALEAAEHGNVDELQRIAQEMLKARPAAKSAGPAAEQKVSAGQLLVYPSELGEPFPHEVVERARRLGMAQVEAKVQLPSLRQLAQETFDTMIRPC
jgi:hypothetical protein